MAFLYLRVSHQPGDNFRVAASTQRQEFGKLDVLNPSHPSFVGPDNKQLVNFNGKLTGMLTVWRKLCVEVDSMPSAPTPSVPPKKGAPDHNLLSGLVSWQANALTPDRSILRINDWVPSQNFYAGGSITIFFLPSGDFASTFEILGHTKATLDQNTLRPVTEFYLAGVPTDTERSMASQNGILVVDDDERRLPPGWTNLLPKYGQDLITDQVIEKFRPAYVEVFDAVLKGLNPREVLDKGRINSGSFPKYDLYNVIIEDDKRDLPKNDPLFWSHLVVAGYQGLEDADLDPGTEIGTPSETALDAKLSVIYLETIRDDTKATFQNSDPAIARQFYRTLHGAVAHELAHAPGGRPEEEVHQEGGLMGSGPGFGFPDIETMNFRGLTLRRFRAFDRWFK